MTWSDVTLLTTAVLLLLLWWVWVAASRLDRLHRKVSASRAALDTQLVRRASASAELAASGLLDPVSSVLVAEAAWGALAAGEHGRTDLVAAFPELTDLTAPSGLERVLDDEASGRAADGGTVERDQAESELSRTVRTALSDPEDVEAVRADPLGAELLGSLGDSWYRVQLARRFHNEAVAQTQRVRAKLLVRLLRLHGHAHMPHTVEMDDAWPEGLARPGEVA